MIEIYESFIFITLIFAILSVYFSIKSWFSWRDINFETIKARVFLDKSFLHHNYQLTLAAVLILTLVISFHVIMEYMELTGNVSYNFYYIYYGIFPVAMISLALLMHKWNSLLNKKP